MSLKSWAWVFGLLALAGCSGGSGGSSASDNIDEQPPVVDPPATNPDQIRLYQVGDVIQFSGTLSRTEQSTAAVTSDVAVRVEFLENTYSYSDKNVLAVQSTLTVAASGEQISRTTHIWQEPNGAFYDLNDEYGNYYMNSATNEYGVEFIPVPLLPFTHNEYQFYTMSGGHTSTPITMGERSVDVGEEQTVTGSLGTLVVYPVTRVDDYSYLVTFDVHKRDETVVDEISYRVSPAKGIIGINDTYRRYSPTGVLEMTITLDMQADEVNF